MLKVYLQDPIKSGAGELVKASGITLWEKVEDVDLTSLNGGGLGLLDKVDGIILEVTEPSDQLNYILAQAILQQKPTLCLYQKNKEPRYLLSHLKRKGVPKGIQIKAYTQNTLNSLVNKFLQDLGDISEVSDKPNIKFTLRITEKIEKYLDYKSKKGEVNKADYLRQLIEKEINKDDDYDS